MKRHGKVVAHKQWLMFSGDTFGSSVGFQINEAGRQRVLTERRKNVHAFVWGYYPEMDEATVVHDWSQISSGLVRVRYNPYEAGEFRTESGVKVNSAEQVWLTPGGVYVLNPY